MRLKRLLKNKGKVEPDYYLIYDAPKLIKSKLNNEDHLTLTLHKMGPPSFIKTKFKNDTNKIYRTVNGKFFGC